MKNKSLFITLLAAVTLIVGCNKEKTAAQQIEDLKVETKQAVQDMKDYTFAEKADFVKAMQVQLLALDQDLDTLAAKIEKSSDAVKAEAKPKLQALRDQAATLNQQLADAQNATESTWDSVKATSKTAYASLKNGFMEARQWTSDKIAP